MVTGMTIKGDVQAVSLLGSAFWCGREAEGEFQMATAPEVLFTEGRLVERLAKTVGEVDVRMVEGSPEPQPDEFGTDQRTLPRGDQMSRMLAQNIRLSKLVRSTREAGPLPFVEPTSCSAALGVLGGLDDPGVGLIWFDAHSDAMTPEFSVNGFFEGMPVSTIAGHCWNAYAARIPGFHTLPEDQIVTVGYHEVYQEGERGKEYHGRAMGTVVDPPVIAKLGFEAGLTAALDLLSARTDRVYVHLDADVIDADILRANAHAARGGLHPDQLHLAWRLIAERFDVSAFVMASWDPTYDPRGLDVLVPIVTDGIEVFSRSNAARAHRAQAPNPTA